MPQVNIRLIELQCSEKRSYINYLMANVYTEENHDKISIQIEDKNILKNTKTFSLKFRHQRENKLHLDLKRRRLIIKDDIIGKLTVPLKWFPKGKIVREWFPVIINPNANNNDIDNCISNTDSNGQKISPMILLDIHIAKKSQQPFNAPFASLNVRPSWNRPTLSTESNPSEFLPLPPLVYVYGVHPVVNIEKEIPAHQPFFVIADPRLQQLPQQQQQIQQQTIQNPSQNQMPQMHQEYAPDVYPSVSPSPAPTNMNNSSPSMYNMGVQNYNNSNNGYNNDSINYPPVLLQQDGTYVPSGVPAYYPPINEIVSVPYQKFDEISDPDLQV